MALFLPLGLLAVKQGQDWRRQPLSWTVISAHLLAPCGVHTCLPSCLHGVGGHELGKSCTPQIPFNYKVCNLRLLQESICSGLALSPLHGVEPAGRDERQHVAQEGEAGGGWGNSKNWGAHGSQAS